MGWGWGRGVERLLSASGPNERRCQRTADGESDPNVHVWKRLWQRGPPSPTAQPGSRTDVFIAGQGLHIQLGIGGFQCDVFYKKQPDKQTKKVQMCSILQKKKKKK